jgi:hypothetical protein
MNMNQLCVSLCYAELDRGGTKVVSWEKWLILFGIMMKCWEMTLQMAADQKGLILMGEFLFNLFHSSTVDDGYNFIVILIHK